jgi:hypothetical protein
VGNLGLGVVVSLLRFSMPTGLKRYYGRGHLAGGRPLAVCGTPFHIAHPSCECPNDILRARLTKKKILWPTRLRGGLIDVLASAGGAVVTEVGLAAAECAQTGGYVP